MTRGDKFFGEKWGKQKDGVVGVRRVKVYCFKEWGRRARRWEGDIRVKTKKEWVSDTAVRDKNIPNGANGSCKST